MRLKAIPCLIFAFCLAHASARAETPHTPQIETRYGPVSGVAHDGYTSYLGLPYAAPPVGALRWAKPQAPSSWRTVRDASDFGAECPQTPTPTRIAGFDPLPTSEDCLTLNIWAPTAPADKDGAAVIVWIHGGGNTNGATADYFYNGQAFARDGVVFVSINYRLGVLGFFAHPDLGKAANFGLWDQIAALQWVRDNIAAFGGDPRRVTVMGESAGGEDILALMASPAARGLFQQAILESAGGGWGPPQSLSDAQADGLGVQTSLDAGDIKALRAAPVADLLALNASFTGPVIDDDLLPEAPLQALTDGSAAKIPVLIGTNQNEGSLLGDSPGPVEQNWPKLSAEDLKSLRAIYQPKNDDAFAREIFRDAYFSGPSRFIANAEDGWLYRFDYVLSPLRPRRSGANHGSELPLVFKNWPRDDLDATDHMLRRLMHDTWVAFAKTGKPDMADWRPFTDEGREMRFDANPHIQPIEDKTALDLLDARLAPIKAAVK